MVTVRALINLWIGFHKNDMSPRLPVYACAITRFQKPQQLGRCMDRALITSRAQRADPDLSGQRCCKLLLKLAKKKAVPPVRHCKESRLQKWPLTGRTTIPRVPYGIGLRMSLRRRTILFFFCYRRLLASPSPFTLFAGRCLHGRQNHRSLFCSGRGESLVSIARFGKPLFSDMHHGVHAVAGALRKANVACPGPDVSNGWPVM